MSGQPMTRDEFIDFYLRNSGIAPDFRTATGYVVPGHGEEIAEPCDCGEPDCHGWQMRVVRHGTGGMTQPADNYAHLPDAADLVPLLESAGLGPELRQAEADMATLKAEQGVGSVCPDYPDLDATDGAHPAWWRGHEHTTAVICKLVNQILDGDAIRGVCGEPWQSTRLRLHALRAERTEITALLDRYEIACDGGTITWPLVKRVQIACCAAVDESDAAYITALRAENAALVVDNARLMGMLEGEP